MALCDYLISADIAGYDCENPMVKGAEPMGLLINRADIDTLTISGFNVTAFTLKCGAKQAHKVYQSGKQPWAGTQQEMVEGNMQNSITNTVQFVIGEHSSDTAEDIFDVANGEFVAILPDKMGNYQVYGAETGLHCTGQVRELYSDDYFSGWLVTMTEEGALRGNLFTTSTIFANLQVATSACT